jgi:hypothetical protein
VAESFGSWTLTVQRPAAVHLEDARPVDDVLGSLDIERTKDEVAGPG